MGEGAAIEDCYDLPSLVETMLAADWRILDLRDSTRQEFDAFERGHLREREELLLDHPTPEVRTAQEKAWRSWLRGHRRSMGFATFLLGRAADPEGAAPSGSVR